MGRCPCSRLDVLFPKGNKKVEKAQEKQKQCHDNSKRLRVFVVKKLVLSGLILWNYF